MSQAWMPDQVTFVKLAYPCVSNPELASYLGCTISRLEAFAKRHRLRKIRSHGHGICQALELTGLRFGLLVAIEKTGKKQKNNYMWRCQCDCGHTCQVRATLLRYQRVISCGCTDQRRIGVNHHRRGGYGDISGSVWSKIRSHAKERGIYWDIDVEYAWELFQRQGGRCVLSGLTIGFPRKFKDTCATASLDRIDSTLGYTVDNVQWLHKDINTMKNNHKEPYFIDLCQAVARHNIGGGKRENASV